VTETYVQIGTAPSWISVFMLMPALLVNVAMRWFGKQRPVLGWWHGAILALWVPLAFSGIPDSWLMCVGILGVAAWCAFFWDPFPKAQLAKRHKSDVLEKQLPIYAKLKPWVRGGVALVTAVGAVLITVMQTNELRTAITFGPAGVSCSRFFGSSKAARAGLEVDVSTPEKSLFDIRPWRSWSSHNGMSDGPFFASNDVFWGPHGLVRGDELGKRLCTWAGVQPTNRTIALR